MLELINIKKDYPAGSGIVHALKGINLKFRKSDFVSILGPSGCGKTTLLNIIGGLDKYTEGDLIINGISTKSYKDRDWDTYRNHSIGFVFQSYNLIPHQTVLQNVELALTLSGVSKSERRKRAKKALEEVGLGDQFNKRPSQMSGGQMQRVAIARALVNNPDIILADEPTGALDTETSVQVMEILKKISKERLIVMVTHNPELAEKYSTRIINMLDGEIKGDSKPLTEDEIREEKNSIELQKGKKIKKPSMSFMTAFGLSLKNLFTKKGRTVLTSFAGSIGIIGIALIFSVSQGTTAFINSVQEDTLSSYPLTIEATHMDMSTIVQTFIGAAQNSYSHEKDAVYQKSALYDMINAFNDLEESKNDLKSFKKFIEDRKNDENDETGLRDALSGVQYSYDLDLLIYTENVDGKIIRSDTTELFSELMKEYFGMNLAENTSALGGSSNMMSNFSSSSYQRSMWKEMLSGDNGETISPLIKKQYDMVYGDWPTEYNEIVLVLDENNELDDMTLYALGLKTKEEIDKISKATFSGEDIEISHDKWSYEEICGMNFRTILNSNVYSYDDRTGTYTDLRETETGLRYLFDNGIDLKVTGILRPNPDATSAMLEGSSIGYTTKLTKYVIDSSSDSEAITAQTKTPSKDIFTGLPFKESTKDLSVDEKTEMFKNYINDLDENEKAALYVKICSIPSDDVLKASVEQAMSAMTREIMEESMKKALVEQMNMSDEDISKYLSGMTDEALSKLIKQGVEEQVKVQYAEKVAAQMAGMTNTQLSMALDASLPQYTNEMCADYYDSALTFSDSTYENNLLKLGQIDLDSPTKINLYSATFASKDTIEQAIADYNDTVDEQREISYTDYIGLLLSSVTTIINAISYVLIAFVSISLIVSSIMIGVITLISVQERTKEIGILRAIGASKKDVSSMFNAETLIIGFTSGMFGILLTYILIIPINAIIHSLTDISNLSAYLPVSAAVTLVIISMLLTLISGIIPSRSASKKDPVIALRTE